MRSRGLCLLRALQAQGAVTWKDGVPSVLVYEGSCYEGADLARLVFREDRQTILAVLRRAQSFWVQLAAPGPDPFLRFRAPKWTAEGCPSCGGKLTEHEFLRCGLCALGAELALAAPAQAQRPAREEQVA